MIVLVIFARGICQAGRDFAGSKIPQITMLFSLELHQFSLSNYIIILSRMGWLFLSRIKLYQTTLT